LTTTVAWPPAKNVIRGQRMNGTFGMVRNHPNGKVVFVRSHGARGLQIRMAFESGQETLYTFYAHMQHMSVNKGKELKQGEIIGSCGKSGNATNLSAKEDHLHFETRSKAECGLRLEGRVSPLKVFGICPLHHPVAG